MAAETARGEKTQHKERALIGIDDGIFQGDPPRIRAGRTWPPRLSFAFA